ncbi:unnamed protein product [Cunninghamella blakesleeana]
MENYRTARKANSRIKNDNQKVCSERDELQEKLCLITSRNNTASVSSQAEKPEVDTIDIDNNNYNDNLVSKQGSVDFGNPVLPTRSPFRETDNNNINNNSSTKLSSIGVVALDNSTNTSLSISQGPVSPKIIEHDAKLFAQYQSAVLKRDMIDNKLQKQQAPPVTLVPSKSSTLPSQSRDSRVVNRKQHNSMVFPSSIIIPTNSKKEDVPSATHPLDQSPLHRSRPNTTQQHPTVRLAHQSPNELNSISDVTVKVVGSMLKSNEKGKDVIAFILSVGKHQNNRYEELWRVEKLYSDFLDLDFKLKTQMRRNNVYKMTRLPEKQLFATRSPNKLDQRRIALEKYLQNAITLPMDDIGDLCEFLSTDVVEQPCYTNERKKEGYLIKRGKNFGGWKTRYFVIKKKRLDYYEAKEGSKLGSIQLEGAQIGRQTSPDTIDENENVYRHAFLIVEPKKTALGNFTKHILCASNDSERDEWITALMEVIHYSTENYSTHSSNPPISSTRNASSSTSLSLEKQRKKSADKRKPSKGEIRTVAATPISQLRIDPSQVIDIEKLTSVPTLINNNTKDDSITAGSTSIDIMPSEMNDNSSSIRSNSISLSSPQSLTSVESPLTPNQHHQFNNFGHSTDKFAIAPSIQQQLDLNNSTDDVADISNTLRPDSPISTSQLDKQESDDSATNEHHQQQQTDKKNKSKAANRMTLLGKKIFGNQQRSSANQIEGNAINGSSNSNNMNHGRPTSPILNYSSTSYHPLATVSHEQQKGNTQKSLRHILSRSQSDNSEHNSAIANRPLNSKQVFGVTLEEAVRVSRISKNYHLPAVVFRCIEYLDAKNAVLEEGLYRLSGSNTTIQNLKKRFDQEGDIPLLNSKEEYDVHAIAGLLKMWLRELPVSVLTRELWPEFIKVIGNDSLKKKILCHKFVLFMVMLYYYRFIREKGSHQ